MPREVPVLIAGAGPVGLTLAADLAWRGVASLIVDPQVEVHPHPRAISIGVRTMEHFRRLGLDQLAIAAGVPLSIFAIDDPDIATLYERRWVLVRPDGHVAWRSDAEPADAATLIARVAGGKSHISRTNGGTFP